MRIARLVIAAALGLPLLGCGQGEEYYFFHHEPNPTPAEDAGPANQAPQITLVFVAPLETDVGAPITLSATASDLNGDKLRFEWTARTGSIKSPKAADAIYTCKKHGKDIVQIAVSDGRLISSQSVVVFCF